MQQQLTLDIPELATPTSTSVQVNTPRPRRALTGLTDEQRTAAGFTEGRRLLSAGPGAGKTRTLIAHVAHLLGEGAAPEEILLVTFTRQATAEMKTRLTRAHHLGRFVQVSTLHALALRLWTAERERQAAWDGEKAQDFSLIPAGVHLEILEKTGLALITPERLQSCLGLLKAGWGGTHADFIDALPGWSDDTGVRATAAENGLSSEDFLAAVQAYEQEKRKRNLYEHDDVFAYAQQICSPDVLASLYSHICVDEVQDTNRAQYGFLRALWRDAASVLCVGDVDQAIYSFRGAHPTGMTALVEKEGFDLHKLNRTFRFGEGIAACARHLIGQVDEGRSVRVDLTTTHGGGRVAYGKAKTKEGEILAVAASVARLLAQGVPASEIAILAPSMRAYGGLRAALEARGVPVSAGKGKIPARIRPLLHLCRLAAADDMDALWTALDRILGYFPGVGLRTVQKQLSSSVDLGSFWQYADRIAEQNLATRWGEALCIVSGCVQELGHAALAHQVFDVLFGFEQEICAFCENWAPESKSYKNFCAACEAADNVTVTKLAMAFDVYVAEVGNGVRPGAVVEWADAGGATLGGETVALSTIHAAKGLEWDYIFAMGMHQGNCSSFPFVQSPDFACSDFMRHQDAEAARLVYVALTRAKKTAFFSYVDDGFSHANLYLRWMFPQLREQPRAVRRRVMW
ncbi:hypothetical protein CRD17_01350 [Corynebacterium sp. LK30]|uniref:ATP-dependent helicase n=1 Tax=Corynebacterium sp. LK30 TaxID=2044577 RepID=UPI00165274AD|nr:ATP-dependent helicase [Corynebacterium sp. LK30]MBC6805863.1 hypothetical protein [Corynebacterium sp. LK30]